MLSLESPNRLSWRPAIKLLLSLPSAWCTQMQLEIRLTLFQSILAWIRWEIFASDTVARTMLSFRTSHSRSPTFGEIENCKTFYERHANASSPERTVCTCIYYLLLNEFCAAILLMYRKFYLSRAVGCSIALIKRNKITLTGVFSWIWKMEFT